MLINTSIYDYITYLIVFIFLAVIAVSIKKKKKIRTTILMISVVVFALASIGLSSMSATLYVVNEDYSHTTYHVFGKPTLKFESKITMKSKSLEYLIDPDPGKVMVLNQSFMDLYLEEEPFNPAVENIKIPAWTNRKLDIPGIDIFPDNTSNGNLFGTKNPAYKLSKY